MHFDHICVQAVFHGGSFLSTWFKEHQEADQFVVQTNEDIKKAYADFENPQYHNYSFGEHNINLLDIDYVVAV